MLKFYYLVLLSVKLTKMLNPVILLPKYMKSNVPKDSYGYIF